MKFFKVLRVQKSANAIIFDHDNALIAALRQAGERFHLAADGQIALEVDDPVVLQKAADHLYNALTVDALGRLGMCDNPHALTSFSTLKRDRGDGSFVSAHRQLVAHKTGPGNPGPTASISLAKVASSIGDETAVGTAITKLHQSGARGGSMALEKVLRQAERKQFKLACRRAITKAAQSRYPDGESAKRTLMQCLLAEGVDPARLGFE